MTPREQNIFIVDTCIKDIKELFTGEGDALHDTIAVFHVLDTPQGKDPATGVKVLFTGCDKHALPQIMETMAHFNPALVEVMLRTAIKLQFELLDAKRQAEARKN